MRNEIRDIQKRLGITAIFVTHDQVEALTMLRPERVRLLADGETAPVRGTARVEDGTYVGNHVDYLLAFPGGGTLALHEPTGIFGGNRRKAGETVGITWDAQNERLFDQNNAAVPGTRPA
jgi:putative spermidine/putrescine transport system ATP-binding protein